MKKILLKSITILLLFLILTPVNVRGEEDLNLSLQEAVELALENNLELKLEEINLEKAKLEYQKKQANNLLNQSRYSQLEADYSLAITENTYHNVYNNLVQETIRQYTNLWLQELDLQIKEKEVELEEKLLNQAKAQYEIGEIGSIELLEQENALQDSQFNLEKARDENKQSLRVFQAHLGLDLNPVITELKPAVWEITEEEAINKALENSTELRLKEKELELAELALEKAELSSAELDRKIKELELEAAKIEKESSRQEIINSTQEVFYQFLQAVKKIALQQESLTEAKEKYLLKQEQYKAGLITETEVLQYQLNMLNSEYQYRSSLADYYLQEHALRKAMGLKTGVFNNEQSNEN